MRTASGADRATASGTNVCRLAALASLLAFDHGVCAGMTGQMLELGFSPRAVERPEEWQRARTGWTVRPAPPRDEVAARSECVRRWRALNSEPSRAQARSFALHMLPSQSDRESVAAAAVLWREMVDDSVAAAEDGSARNLPDPATRPVPPTVGAWRDVLVNLEGGGGSSTVLLALLVRQRLELAMRSSDRVVRLFAQAAGSSTTSSRSGTARGSTRVARTSAGAARRARSSGCWPARTSRDGPLRSPPAGSGPCSATATGAR